MICINCNYEHDEKFCPNCGEKAAVPKITFRSMFRAALSTITNMDKGFLYNIKHLFSEPDKIVRDYLNGKRKGILNPISFLIISVTIYLIVDSLIIINLEFDHDSSKIYSYGYEAGRFIKLHFKYFWILSVIWLSLTTRFFYRKYNYAEHLAINALVIGQSTLVGLLGFLLLKIALLFNPLVYLSIAWLLYHIHKRKKKDFEAFLLSFSSTILFFVLLVILVILIGVVRS